MKPYLLLIIFTFLSAETFIVDQNGSGDYSDIQIAINENNDGDTLLIYPGIYFGRIVIEDKNLVIISSEGASETIFQWIHITDSDMIIKGIASITGGSHTIKINNSSLKLINSITIEDEFNIELYNSNLELINCTIIADVPIFNSPEYSNTVTVKNSILISSINGMLWNYDDDWYQYEDEWLFNEYFSYFHQNPNNISHSLIFPCNWEECDFLGNESDGMFFTSDIFSSVWDDFSLFFQNYSSNLIDLDLNNEIDEIKSLLMISSTSSCLDGGHPDLDGYGISWEFDSDDQDPDGTRMDIGAFYYEQLLIGDVNQDGDINVLDISLMLNFILGLSIPTETQFILADLDGSEFIDILDIVITINLILYP